VSNKIYDLTVGEFSKFFGINNEEMPPECVEIINKHDFRYTCCSKIERDRIILNFVKKMDNKIYSLSGKYQEERWEKGWGENLKNFVENDFDTKFLIPKYNKQSSYIVLKGDYVKPVDLNFEINFIELIRAFVFYRYLKDQNSIHEFGCGSAYNLVAFSEIDPDKQYYGYDWVQQSISIIDAVRKHLGHNVHGSIFNMFDPNRDLQINGGVALTIGALEQLGSDHHKFIDFLLDKPFSRYVHLNSISELYDSDNSLVDYLIRRFEKSRNYCNGFFGRLRKLEKDGVINILKMQKVSCGSKYGDVYSITVWEKT